MGRIPWADLRLALLTSILVLASYIGFVEGFNGAHAARNLPETVTAFAQLAYGILGGLALTAVLRRQRFARQALEFFGAIFVATAILSPVVSGGASVTIGVASGAVASALVALIIWLWGANRVSVPQRPQPAASGTSQPVAAPVPVVDRWDRELAELRAKMKEMDVRHISGPQQLPRVHPA
jgi:hypothetical protein